MFPTVALLLELEHVDGSTGAVVQPEGLVHASTSSVGGESVLPGSTSPWQHAQVTETRERGGAMGTEAIKVAIDGAVDYLRANPDDARSTDSLATARIVDGLVVHVTGPSGEF